MSRTIKKTGDIFCVKMTDNTKKYFQYIANDRNQLNSDVIRAFKHRYSMDENPDISEIVKNDIDFYAHCLIKVGLKMGLWEKAGNSKEPVDLSNIVFKGTNDYGVKRGEKPITISENWYIWRIEDEGFTRIGKMRKEYEDAYIGLVINPNGIIELLKGNEYPNGYPK